MSADRLKNAGVESCLVRVDSCVMPHPRGHETRLDVPPCVEGRAAGWEVR